MRWPCLMATLGPSMTMSGFPAGWTWLEIRGAGRAARGWGSFLCGGALVLLDGTAAAAAGQAVAKELVAEEAVTEASVGVGGQAVMGCIAGDGIAAGSTAAGVIAEKALEERLASSSNSTAISGGSDVPAVALRCSQPGDGTALIGGRCCNS